MSKALQIVVLRDRRPGEWRKSEGLAAMIARTMPATIRSLDAAPRRFARNRVRLWALDRFAGEPQRALKLLYGLEGSAIGSPDIVIGAGRPTAAAGILIARQTGARFIYCGHLNDYDPGQIDLMLVASPRFSGGANTVLAPIPCTIDAEAFGPPRRIGSVEDLRGARASLFLGGSKSRYSFSRSEWGDIADFVSQSADIAGLRWSVASSRRTPTYAADLFAGLARDGRIDELLDYRSAGAGSADRLFGADVVVVTEDSLSMIAEGLAALRPVVALRPQNARRHDYAEEVATMACNDSLSILPIRSLTPSRFAVAIASTRAPREDRQEAILAALRPLAGSRERTS